MPRQVVVCRLAMGSGHQIGCSLRRSFSLGQEGAPHELLAGGRLHRAMIEDVDRSWIGQSK